MMKTTGFDYFQTSNNAGQWIEHNYKAYANLGDPNSDKIQLKREVNYEINCR